MQPPPDVLDQLMQTIENRKAAAATHSYTAQLLRGGIESIGAKVLEEAQEVVEAGRLAQHASQRDALIHEAADLVFHLLVLLSYRDAHWQDVRDALARRQGLSGLEEKARRGQAGEA